MTARSTRVILRLLALCAAASGCSERPKAPPLVNEAVYMNETIGLRFLTPEGWSITSRANLPSGPLAKPMILVAYHQKRGDTPAALEVLAADLPVDTELGQWLRDSRVGQGEWALKTPAETLNLNGMEAMRYLLSQHAGKTEHLRETTAFRRGGRVYFFIISYAPSDPSSRDLARRSIESATWSEK